MAKQTVKKTAPRKAAAKTAAPKSENKTRPTKIAPKAFIAALDDGPRKRDAEILLAWFGKITGWKPQMWGPSIIGYGLYHYQYESGREGDMCVTGFAPRGAKLVVYVLPGYSDLSDKLKRLGKHKIGKSCLYINTLADIDMGVLEEIVRFGVADVKKRHTVTAT